MVTVRRSILAQMSSSFIRRALDLTGTGSSDALRGRSGRSLLVDCTAQCRKHSERSQENRPNPSYSIRGESARLDGGDKRDYRKCAGINRHVVGNERVLQEGSSESILAPSLAASIARCWLKRR